MKLQDLFEMSAQDLFDAERIIEDLFKELKLDVQWTTHFEERAEGREDAVKKEELVDAFRKMKMKHGDKLVAARTKQKEFVAILKDLAADLNIPFSISFDKKNPMNNKYRLRGITIMRKDPHKFVSNIQGGRELKV